MKLHGNAPLGPKGRRRMVLLVTEQGLRLFEAKRRSESKKAEQLGVSMESTAVAQPLSQLKVPGPTQ